MALIMLCHHCDGMGKVKSTVPFLKRMCPMCKGRGKLPFQR